MFPDEKGLITPIPADSGNRQTNVTPGKWGGTLVSHAGPGCGDNRVLSVRGCPLLLRYADRLQCSPMERSGLERSGCLGGAGSIVDCLPAETDHVSGATTLPVRSRINSDFPSLVRNSVSFPINAQSIVVPFSGNRGSLCESG